jgi:hypothetical protein
MKRGSPTPCACYVDKFILFPAIAADANLLFPGLRPSGLKVAGPTQLHWPSFPDVKGPPILTIFAYFETRPGMNYRAMPEGVWGDPRGSSAKLREGCAPYATAKRS